MTLRTVSSVLLALGALAPAAAADIVWTGAVSDDIFDEANWDLSNSTVTMVNPNVTIDDDVIISNTAQPVQIPDIGGQVRFQIGDGYTLTMDSASVYVAGNDGIGGVPGTSVGPKVRIQNGSKLHVFFITNRTALDVGSGCKATFGGGATPINGSTVDMDVGSLVNFLDETVAAFTAEHLTKFTVEDTTAVIGVNLDVVSDGNTGCNLTAIPNFPVYCVGAIGSCPCGNGNDGSMGSAGCANSSSIGGAALIASGSTSVQADDLRLDGLGLVPGQLAVFFQGDVNLNGGSGIIFGDGLRCAGNQLQRLETVVIGPSGNLATTVNLGQAGSVLPGQTLSYQLWYADNTGSPCGAGFNVTNAVEVSWTP